MDGRVGPGPMPAHAACFGRKSAGSSKAFSTPTSQGGLRSQTAASARTGSAPEARARRPDSRFLPSWVGTRAAGPEAVFLPRMSKNGKWGGEPELLVLSQFGRWSLTPQLFAV